MECPESCFAERVNDHISSSSFLSSGEFGETENPTPLRVQSLGVLARPSLEQWEGSSFDETTPCERWSVIEPQQRGSRLSDPQTESSFQIITESSLVVLSEVLSFVSHPKNSEDEFKISDTFEITKEENSEMTKEWIQDLQKLHARIKQVLHQTSKEAGDFQALQQEFDVYRNRWKKDLTWICKEEELKNSGQQKDKCIEQINQSKWRISSQWIIDEFNPQTAGALLHKFMCFFLIFLLFAHNYYSFSSQGKFVSQSIEDIDNYKQVLLEQIRSIHQRNQILYRQEFGNLSCLQDEIASELSQMKKGIAKIQEGDDLSAVLQDLKPAKVNSNLIHKLRQDINLLQDKIETFYDHQNQLVLYTIHLKGKLAHLESLTDENMILHSRLSQVDPKVANLSASVQSLQQENAQLQKFVEDSTQMVIEVLKSAFNLSQSNDSSSPSPPPLSFHILNDTYIYFKSLLPNWMEGLSEKIKNFSIADTTYEARKSIKFNFKLHVKNLLKTSKITFTKARKDLQKNIKHFFLRSMSKKATFNKTSRMVSRNKVENNSTLNQIMTSFRRALKRVYKKIMTCLPYTGNTTGMAQN